MSETAQPELRDLVEDLRQRCTATSPQRTCADVYLPEEQCLFCRAADELAELRAENERLQKLNKTGYCVFCGSDVADAEAMRQHVCSLWHFW